MSVARFHWIGPNSIAIDEATIDICIESCQEMRPFDDTKAHLWTLIQSGILRIHSKSYYEYQWFHFRKCIEQNNATLIKRDLFESRALHSLYLITLFTAFQAFGSYLSVNKCLSRANWSRLRSRFTPNLWQHRRDLAISFVLICEAEPIIPLWID